MRVDLQGADRERQRLEGRVQAKEREIGTLMNKARLRARGRLDGLPLPACLPAPLPAPHQQQHTIWPPSIRSAAKGERGAAQGRGEGCQAGG